MPNPDSLPTPEQLLRSRQILKAIRASRPSIGFRYFVALLLIGMSLFFLWQAYQARAQSMWVSTFGEIADIRSVHWKTPPRQSMSGAQVGLERTSTWMVYSYTVMGKQFLGDALAGSGWTPGEAVVVYYDPDHPARSATRLPAVSDPKVSMAFSAVAFILGVFIGYRTLSLNEKGHRFPGLA